MNSKTKRYFVAFLALFCLGGVTACASKDIMTPEDAIIDAYGDKQFRISFDSTNLEHPLADMYYTAKSMPVLPTPSKVGYVFDGWYFDENYIDECNIDDGDLLWKMTNVTLFAKWEVEKIVNNGQYDIEYEAHIIEESISYGPRAEENNFYRFDEDIIDYGTYIEKNDNGTYLRIQYDCRTRGPVLGGEDADADNFSPQTYTITDPKQRINEELCIFDRTSTLQTLYYDISGLNLSDPIILFVTYYNWVDEMPEKFRKGATVTYNVEFNITRFIGFGASFVNTNSRLEDGIYTIPTHYGALTKERSILDMFNPVTAYIKASKGNYTLYKPMSAYNNDFGEIKPEHFPLRTTGFAKELTAFLCDQDIKLTKEQDENIEGEYFIPQLFKASHFIDVRVEFNGETGQYYYVFDLGKSLDKDIILFGGSCGAMEEMFSFPYMYRRLSLDYKSMVRLANWSYKEPTGDRYVFKRTFSLYPGAISDFKDSNTDYEQYQKYLSGITYPNCFYTYNENHESKIYTSRITISPLNKGKYYLQYSRNNFQLFEMSFEIFGYDPLRDGTLYSRDSTFSASSVMAFSNSSENKNINGKSLKVGDAVSVYDLYKEKISSTNTNFTFEAYEVDSSLNIDFSKKVKLKDNFIFTKNVALVYSLDNKTYNSQAVVILAEKQNAKVTMIDSGWELEAGNTFVTDKRYNIGDNIVLPNIQYIYYNEKQYTRGITKDDLPDAEKITDFIKVSFWGLSQEIYTAHASYPSPDSDLTMDQERIVASMQFVNQFGEFETYYCLFKGVSAGVYTINDDMGNLIANGDLKYDAGKRHRVRHEVLKTVDIFDETWTEKVPNKLTLNIDDEGVKTQTDINFNFALIFLKDEKLKSYSLDEIYDLIKKEKYAVVYLYYNSDYNDEILLKAQYNFKVEGEGVGSFNIIKGSTSYFTNQNLNIYSPLLTNANYKNLGYAKLDVLKKSGNHYTDDIYSKISRQDHGYMSELEFHESGTYLLTYTFNLVYDENGNLLFKYNNGSDRYNEIKFTISQQLNIYERAIDYTIHFATDTSHPFNPESDELFGYKIETKDNIQYASKLIRANEKVKAFTQDAFKNTSSKLFRWSDKGNNKIAVPGQIVNETHVKLSTLDPVLFANWDDGCVVRIFTEKKDEITKETIITEKDGFVLAKDSNEGNDYYTVDSSHLMTFKIDQGYQLYGWRANHNVFFEEVEINGVEQAIKTNFHKGYLQTLLTLYEDTSFTAILKKPTSVLYEAYDTNGNKVSFLNNISNDYKAYIDDTLKESVSRVKFNELLNAQCSDLELKLQYWSVYDSVSDSYLKCDLETLVLLEQYSVNKIIKLRAIFG